MRLALHLENQQLVVLGDPSALIISYLDFPELLVWDKTKLEWKLSSLHANRGEGERFYLRTHLNTAMAVPAFRIFVLFSTVPSII